MPRFCGANGSLNTLLGAHFSHHYYIRILAHGFRNRLIEAFRIPADFSLRNYTALVFVNKFNRIFDGKNMCGLSFVDIIQQAGKSGGFTATRRPRHENQPASFCRQGF